MNERLKTSLFILLGLTVVAYVLASFFETDTLRISENVALIHIDKPIAAQEAGFFSDEFLSSTDVIEFIEDAEKNQNIRAIIFEINSPGGTAVGSAEIADAVKKVNKTTVAWVREVGASGAYWIASATDVIVAHPLSVVGSIGVIGSYVDVAGLMKEYNVTYNRLVAGKYKDLGTPLKELTTDERDLLQAKLDKMHVVFIAEVAKNRNLSIEKVQELATGEIFLGTEAKEQGLVDELGGKDLVYEVVKKKANVTTVEIVEYEKSEGLFDVLGDLLAKQSFYAGQGIASWFTKQQSTIKT